MASFNISAPGKLLIAGEYAVLDGSKAIVAAVSRRLSIRSAPATELSAPLSPEISRVFELVRERPPALQIDASALYHGERKLGLGSSAAQAVAAAGFVFARRGESLIPGRVFELAHAAHQSVSPLGSGVDVLAAAYGGLLLADPSNLGSPARLDPSLALSGLSMSVIDTGASARTSTFLSAIEEYRLSSPAATRRAFRRLHDAMEEVERAIERHSSDDLLGAFSEYGAAMGALGELTGVPIVEERLSAIDALARAAGGVSKPSGAGGGDIAIAFFRDGEQRAAFERSALGAGFSTIDIRIDPMGACVERSAGSL